MDSIGGQSRPTVSAAEDAAAWLSANCSSSTSALPTECSCKLLSGAFTYVVQVGLAAICFSVLLVKRWRESPRRPWLVWFFDLTKQVFSSGLQHFANIFFGVVLAGSNTKASQCAWYFVLYVITSTAAVFVVALGMRLQAKLVARYNLKLLRTGEYGSPPHWKPWLVQLLIWGSIGLSEKFITTPTLLIPPIHSLLGRLAVWLERPLLDYPHTELVLVMVCAPVLMNVFSVVIFDNIMKRRKPSGDTMSLDGASTPERGAVGVRVDPASLQDALIVTPMRL